MKIFTVAATAAIAMPLLATDALAFICDHHPAAESSGRYADRENSVNLWGTWGTDIGGSRDDGTDVFGGGGTIGINLDKIFPNGVGQISTQFANGTNDDWSFRTKMGAFSVGQNDNFGAGGGWALTAGLTEYDFRQSSFDQEINGQFIAGQAHCFIGNQYKITGQVGFMSLDDDFNDWDVNFGALKGDYWLSDNAVAHGTVSFAESDSSNEGEAYSIGAGFRWQWNPEKPFTFGADLQYMNVEDRSTEDDLWTLMFTLELFSLGASGQPVPSLREYQFHSSHILGAPPGTAFQVR